MLTLFPANAAPIVDSQPETASAPPDTAEPAEFEIVVGRRQLSSLLFVAIVVVVAFSAVAYLVGRSVTPRAVSAAAPQSSPASAPAPVLTIPVVGATIAPAPVRNEPPIFADPVPRKVYIQMAAVEKGLAIIFAEGLRRRGLDGFVAPGPNEKLFRVLIGPLPTEADYTRVKHQVDQIGLNTFPRRYEK